MTPVSLELDDLQGLLVRGYSELPAASFVLFEVASSDRAADWLASTAGIVTTGRGKPAEHAVNVALAASGLQALGLDRQVLDGFSNEFVEGMTTKFRQRILGDDGDSSPESWLWGGPLSAPVHGAILLYAASEAGLASWRSQEVTRAERSGLHIIAELATVDLRGKEHFGFHDGVSQPTMAGLSRTDSAANTVTPGEFILGYPNAYGLFGERPIVPAAADGAGILPRDPGGSGGGDLGGNGSYLVFRQLRQDVRGFWRYLDGATQTPDGLSDPSRRTWLGSKMVGRWPSGAPLVLAPDGDDTSLADANHFQYHDLDPDGLRCPIGAHIRRANPRDSLDPRPGSPASTEVNNHHRILRRGREYGPAVAPATLFDAVADDVERGLHFLCLNASINRQFEFLQHTWINSSKFAGLHEDDDPLVGPRERIGGGFTVPATPLRERYRDLPRFVSVRGGAYFFVPGIRALRYLAEVASPPA